VQHIYGFDERGDLEHPVFQARVNLDLMDAGKTGVFVVRPIV
jgi:hypothetical protein